MAYFPVTNVTAELNALAAAYPQLVHAHPVGLSTHGKDITAVAISAISPSTPPLLQAVPIVRIVAGMRGDTAAVEAALALAFARYLAEAYSADDNQVTMLLDAAVVVVVPVANPDGAALGVADNGDGVLLERNFPIRNVPGADTPAGRALETQAIMAWARSMYATLSINLRAGAGVEVVAYPWHSSIDGSVRAAPAVGEGILTSLALSYASRVPGERSDLFPTGIVNAAAVASLAGSGSMEDWALQFLGEPPLSVHFAPDVAPSAATLATLWGNNAPALLMTARRVLTAARGRVAAPDDTFVADAVCEVVTLGSGLHVRVNHNTGRWWIPLPAGRHDITCSAPGRVSITHTHVVDDTDSGGPVTEAELVEYRLPSSAEAPAPVPTYGAPGSRVQLNAILVILLAVQIVVACAGVVFWAVMRKVH
ncbi:uncharacterized protein AMSG_04926 [Thecamonas trahens ATCC 50062]|uniref:Peptidase M14 domain-containing protein n=1 Tax=Thecamonas trahens ATCC 50062 TaxID=461836 RepID=A0A0L0DB04_THETB|nr:hypothetical protein AMSG_04926 [Thecamonas trahens ATCC 50062]KNC48478.1 hypothetical protein AMSG_04926 [Thecamonas trahens ATCC 50062]|eukprot:XP_013758590.1 hypothetical protein AMSG_04926 [Thecamonas trahens ATCC 50062]